MPNKAPLPSSSCLNRLYSSTQKGGTLIASHVGTLDAQREALIAPDRVRPRSCGNCGCRNLHVHERRTRVLAGHREGLPPMGILTSDAAKRAAGQRGGFCQPFSRGISGGRGRPWTSLTANPNRRTAGESRHERSSDGLYGFASMRPRCWCCSPLAPCFMTLRSPASLS